MTVFRAFYLSNNNNNNSDHPQFQPTKHKNRKKKEFEPTFEFVSTVEEYNKDTWNDVTKYIKRKVRSKVDDKIAIVRNKLKNEVSCCHCKL